MRKDVEHGGDNDLSSLFCFQLWDTHTESVPKRVAAPGAGEQDVRWRRIAANIVKGLTRATVGPAWCMSSTS